MATDIITPTVPAPHFVRCACRDVVVTDLTKSREFYVGLLGLHVTEEDKDNQRRDGWGNPVVPSWYTEASLVLDRDGNPQPVVVREERSELTVTVGADGFSYTREPGFKLGTQS